MNLKNTKFSKILNSFIRIPLKKLIVIISISFLFGMIYHHQQFFPLKKLSSLWHKYLEYFPDLNHRLYSMKLIEINKKYTPGKKNEIFIINDYKEGLTVFSNRTYYDRSTEKKKNLILVQIPRHHNKLIILEASENIKIFRILCDRNDNSFYESWNEINLEFKIIGKSCIHYKAKYKLFDKGIITLPPGGPESSDPIFIEKKNNKTKIKLISN